MRSIQEIVFILTSIGRRSGKVTAMGSRCRIKNDGFIWIDGGHIIQYSSYPDNKAGKQCCNMLIFAGGNRKIAARCRDLLIYSSSFHSL